MGYESATVDAGNNPTIPVAVDQVNGQDIQVVKLDIGGDGASTPLGSLSNGLPVDLKTLAPGAATSSNQSAANTSLASIDSKTPASPATAGNQTTANTSLSSIDTKLSSSATSAKQDTGNTSLASIDSKIPAAPATAGNQTSGNASLTSIDGKVPAKGQAAMAASTPVTIASDQPAVPVSNSGLSNLNITLAALRDALLGVNSKTLSDVVTALGSMTVTVSSELEIKNDTGNPVPVSATSLPLPAGAATSANQSSANTSLASIDGKIPASPAQDRTTAAAPSAMRLSDGAAFYKPTTPSDTQPVSATSLPLPTGAATAANQSSANTSLSNIDSSTTAPTTVLNGKKTVLISGTRVTLAASTAAKSVTIKALAANTGTIYVGDSSVSSSNGFALQAGETVSMDISNLNTVNLDASVSGEGVTYIGVS